MRDEREASLARRMDGMDFGGVEKRAFCEFIDLLTGLEVDRADSWGVVWSSCRPRVPEHSALFLFRTLRR